MKKILTLLSLLICFNILSLESIKDWSAFKNIEIKGKNKYKYFFLDKDIYRHSKSDLSDLRIIDGQNNFVPYYIIEGFKEEKKEDLKYPAKQIKKSVEKNKENSVINTSFDFQVFYTKENYAVNKIELLTENKNNFSTQIALYGRDEKSEWALITKDTIYRIDGFNRQTVSLGYAVTYKFFKITVIDNKENLEIKECIPRLDTIESKYEKYKENTNLAFEIKNENSVSTITIKNPDRLKLSALKIIYGGNFDRRYELYGKENIFFTSGNIYKFEHNAINISNTEINLPYEKTRDENLYLKIFNNNDKALSIDKVEAKYIIDQIIFEYKENSNYKIYFGNINSVKPSYDIEAFRTYIEKENKDQCALEKLTTVKGKTIAAESKNYKTLYNILTILISGILIFVLINVLKKK